MNTIKLSIIIPVYNVEPYITKCINSILTQGHSYIELLLIDDGSPDNAGTICDAYAKKYPFIKTFHQENRGVSSARNLGLKEAKGEWGWFIDSDDWIESDALDIMLPYLDNCNVDIIEFSFKRNKDTISFFPHNITIFENKNIMKFFLCFPKFHLWNKIIKRNIIGSIKFLEGLSIGEDFLFLSQVFDKATKYYFINKVIYNYIDNRTISAMNTLSKQKYTQNINLIINYITKYKNQYNTSNYVVLPCVFINRNRIIPNPNDKIMFLLLQFWKSIPIKDLINSNTKFKQKIYILIYKIYSLWI